MERDDEFDTRLKEALRDVLADEVEDADPEASDTGDWDVDQVAEAVSNRLDSQPGPRRNRWLERLLDGRLSRRQFLKLLGLGAGGVVAASAVGGFSLLSGGGQSPFQKLSGGGQSGFQKITSGPIIVDDFESGDLSNWGGDTGSYVVDSNAPVQEGTYSLKNINDGNGNEMIGAATGKESVPSPGDTFRVWVHPGNATFSISDMWWASDASDGVRNDGYSVRLDADNDNFAIAEWSANSRTQLAVDTAPGTIDSSWFEIEILHEANGSITATLFDAAGTQMSQLTATDTTHITSGAFDQTDAGIEDGRGEGDAYDFWRIV